MSTTIFFNNFGKTCNKLNVTLFPFQIIACVALLLTLHSITQITKNALLIIINEQQNYSIFLTNWKRIDAMHKTHLIYKILYANTYPKYVQSAYQPCVFVKFFAGFKSVMC